MLLFDEADSLFTNRVKVENSVDRFANMETNLLLQEIERFEGVVVLTTNHEKNMDDAFQRRIQFKVSFPFLEADERARIWGVDSNGRRSTRDLDFSLLGESYELSGGYIKNAILKAAYRAAIEDSPITMGHIERAAELECKNAGKIFQSIRSSKVESPSDSGLSGRLGEGAMNRYCPPCRVHLEPLHHWFGDTEEPGSCSGGWRDRIRHLDWGLR